MEPTTQKNGFSKGFVGNLTCLLVAEIMPLGLSGSSGFSGLSKVCFVYFVGLVQLIKQDKPNKPHEQERSGEGSWT
jgi:hypothetical protein